MVFSALNVSFVREKYLPLGKGKYDDLSSFNSNWSSSLFYIFIYIINSIFDCTISSVWSD